MQPWSYSRLSTFDACPYQYWLKYIAGIAESDRFFASYGSFMHKLLEKYFKGKLSGNDLYMEYLLNFHSEVKGERPNAKTAENWFYDGASYFQDFRPPDWEIADVEKRLEFNIGSHSFVGIIDLVVKQDGKYVIVDHKSRNLKPRSKRNKPTLKDAELDRMLTQLYLYAGALEQHTGEFPCKLCFNCFRNNTVIEEPFRMEAFNDVVCWAEKQISLIENAKEFYPMYDSFYCRYICGVSEECCYFQIENEGRR